MNNKRKKYKYISVILIFFVFTMLLLKTTYVFADNKDVFVKVATKSDHCLAIKNDGTVWAWGRNNYGQLGDGTTANKTTAVQVSGLSGITDIATGACHSLALKNDGTVWAWGYNLNGQLGDGTTADKTTAVQVSGLSGIIAIACGYDHSLALKNDGTVWAWGYNYNGQLGDSTQISRSTAVQVYGLSGVRAIVAGQYYSLALKNNGTVWACGYAGYGLLGYSQLSNATIAMQVSGLSNITAIAGGAGFQLALKNDGTVWAWGENYAGQIGDGSDEKRDTVVQVAGLSGIAAIGAGISHGLAVKNDGTVWAWGGNSLYQLGDGTTTIRMTAIQVSGLSGITAVTGGLNHSLALKNDGTVWAWGYNNYGQLGDGTKIHMASAVQINGLSGIAAVCGGDEHSLALQNNGTVWAWGNNSGGQLGDGSAIIRTRAVQCNNLSGIAAIAGGEEHSLALKNDGTVWAWGYNNYGQLGDGTTTTRKIAVQVNNLSGIVAIAGGSDYSLALKNDGTVWAWGYNNSGQLGDGTTTNRSTAVKVNGLSGITAITCGSYQSLALKNDGTVWAWGKNNYGQLGDGTTTDKKNAVQVSVLSGITAIKAGCYHGLALKNDGTVWAWGENTNGQLGDGTTVNKKTAIKISGLSGIINIAANFRHNLALKSDGTVWAWGYNNYGELGDGTTTDKKTAVKVNWVSEITAIAAGRSHSLALKSDGTVWAWGHNNGQLGIGEKAYSENAKWVLRPNTAPLIMVIYPKGNTVYSTQIGNSSLPLSGTINDPEIGDIDTIYYRIDGSPGQPGTQFGSSIVSNNSNQSFPSPSQSINVSGVNEGAHTLYTWVQDNNGGKSAETSIPFYVDKTAPVVGAPTLTASSSSQITIQPNTYDPAVNGVSSGLNSSTPYIYFRNGYDISTWQNGNGIDSGLLPNTQYTYMFRARDNVMNTSGNSAAASKYTLAAVPSLSLSNPASRTVDVSTSDANPYYTQYQVWTTSDGVKYVTSTGTLSDTPQWITLTGKRITVTGLKPNTTYSFNIKARNAENVENPSISSASITTLFAPQPAANLAIPNISSSSIGVSWAPNGNPGTMVYNLVLQNPYTGEWLSNPETTSLSYTFTGLQPNTPYNAWVRVRNQVEWATPEYQLFGTPYTLSNLPATPVWGVAAQTSLKMDWGQNGNPSNTEYRAVLTDPATGVWQANSDWQANIATWTFTGLTPSTRYNGWVQTRNAAGMETAWIDFGIKTTLANIPAGGSITSIAVNSISASWQTNGNTAAQYSLAAFDANDVLLKQNAWTANLNDTITGLNPATTYKIKVKAKNGDGTETAWYQINGSVITVPVAPANLRSTSLTQVSAALAWDAVTGATGYELEKDGAVVDNAASTTYNHTGLAPSSSHTYRARANNAGGPGAWSAPLTILTPPDIPRDVVVTPASGALTISWSGAAGATGYDLEADGTVINNGTNLSYTHTGLGTNTQHTYRVRSKNTGGSGAWTAPAKKYTLANAPAGGIIGTVTNTSIASSWTANGNPAGTYYALAAYNTSDVLVKQNAWTTSLTDTLTGLNASTTYKIKVKAKNGDNLETGWIQINSQTTLPNPPAAPANLRAASVAQTQVVIAWDASAGATGYDVKADGVLVANNISATTYTHSGLLALSAHTYCVSAKNAGGPSAYTPNLNITTLPNPPAAPSITVTPSGNSMAISWSAVASATGYEVSADSGAAIDNGTNLTYTHSSLSTNSQHTYRISAKNTGGSTWCAPVSKYTLANALNSGSIGTVTSTSIQSSWTNNGNPSGTYFALAAFDANDVLVKQNSWTTSLTDTLTGLNVNTAYKLKVKAKNGDNTETGWYNIGTRSTLPNPPAAPANLRTTSISQTQVIIAWDASAGATGYDVKVDGTVASSNVTATTYTHSGLTAASPHTYSICAKNTGGASPYTSNLNVTTLPNPPAAVTNLQLAPTTSTVTLTWNAVAGSTSYDVEKDGTQTVNVTGTTYVHSGLVAGTRHSYRVRANNTGGSGVWTAYTEIVTLLDTPADINALQTTNAVTLSWSPVTGASSYEVEADGVIQEVGAATTKTFINLIPGTQHNYRIRAKTSSRTGEWSSTKSVATNLDIPANIVSTVTDRTVTIMWDAVAGATKYLVEADGTVISGITETSFLHTGLTPGTQHTYRVKAGNNVAESVWSNTSTRTTALAKPAVPANISVASDKTLITVTWDASAGSTSYDVEVDGILTSTTDTSYVHTGLAPGTSHTYRVRAKNSGGKSSWSGMISSSTIPDSELAVSNLRASVTTNDILVEWDAVNGVEGYDIEVDGISQDNGTSTTYASIGFTPGSQHTYRVRIKNGEVSGDWSTLLIVSTIQDIPDMPQGVAAIPDNTEIKVVWSPVDGASGYEVEADGAVTDNDLSTIYIQTGLEPETQHTFRVRAYSTGGTGDWSEAVTGTTLPIPPEAPEITEIVSTGSAITITWNTVGNASSYDVAMDGSIISGINGSSYTFDGLRPGENHVFKVRARNPQNTSEWSQGQTKAALPVIPAVPSNINTLPLRNSVTVSWDTVPYAEGYEIEADGAVIDNGLSLAYAASGFEANTSHTYRIRAKNAVGTGDWSTLITVFTLPVPPDTPQNVSVYTSANGITVSWAPAAGATGYEVEADGMVLDNGGGLTFEHSSLSPETQHTYRVRARNNGGVGDFSMPVTVLTLPSLPAAPINITIEPGETSVALFWASVAGAYGYDIEADGVIVNNGISTTYTDGGLVPGTRHIYRIRARNSSGNGPWSSPESITVDIGTPQSIETIPDIDRITVMWDEINGAAGYDIEVDGIVKDNGNVTVYTAGNLIPDTLHTYRIRAKSANVTGEWSNEAIERTRPRPLGAPEIISADTTQGAISITWESVVDADGYDIEADGELLDNASGTSYVHTGLAPQSLHTYRVRAKNENGAGSFGMTKTVMTRPDSPDIPANISITAEPNRIILTWDAVENATSYDIFADEVIIENVTDTIYADTALIPGTPHVYKIRAQNSGEPGEWTAAINKCTVLPVPANIISYTSSTAITISWDAVSGASAYDIEFDGSVIENGASTSYVRSGLAPLSQHNYRVRAKNINVAGEYSTVSTVSTLPTPPGVPGGIAQTKTNTAVTIAWNPVNGATGYDVEADGRVVDVKNKTTFAAGGLTPNSQHTYRVRAKNAGGASEFSQPLLVKTLPNIPGIPENFKISSVTPDTITVVWDGFIADAQYGTVEYEVEVDGLIKSSGTTYIHQGLLPASSHTYRVRAKNEAGSGAWSALITKATSLAIPANLTTSADQGVITLTWDAVAGADSYDVEIDSTTVVNNTGNQYIHKNIQPNQSHSYRIRARSGANAGNWCDGVIATAPPLTYKESFNTGDEFEFGIAVKNVIDINRQTFTINYDPAKLDVVDLCIETDKIDISTGSIDNTNIKVIQFAPGRIVLKLNESEFTGEYSGIIDTIQFRSKTDGEVSITYSLN